MKNYKKCPWIPEKEFKELENSIWKEINQLNSTPRERGICLIKDEHRKQPRFIEKPHKDIEGLVNIVCSGKENIIIG